MKKFLIALLLIVLCCSSCGPLYIVPSTYTPDYYTRPPYHPAPPYGRPVPPRYNRPPSSGFAWPDGLRGTNPYRM